MRINKPGERSRLFIYLSIWILSTYNSNRRPSVAKNKHAATANAEVILLNSGLISEIVFKISQVHTK